MKKLLPVAAFAIALLSVHISHAAISVGGVLSHPEIFGAYLSIWPTPDFTFDLRATLSTVDGGVTGHIPLARGEHHRHDILVNAMGGYVHAGDHVYYEDRGARVLGMVGYGYQSCLDVRLEGGVSAYDTPQGWQTAPTFAASVGYIF
jgi:hypothetical protein